MAYLSNAPSTSRKGVITNLSSDFTYSSGVVGLTGGKGNFMFQSKQTANNATYAAFTINTSYPMVMIIGQRVTPTISGSNLKIEYLVSGAGSYDTTASNYQVCPYYSNTNALPTSSSNAAGMETAFIYNHCQPSSAGMAACNVAGAIHWVASSSGSMTTDRNYIGYTAANNLIAGIRFSFSSGNIKYGEFSLYYPT